jgi:hypothetical protein
MLYRGLRTNARESHVSDWSSLYPMGSLDSPTEWLSELSGSLFA